MRKKSDRISNFEKPDLFLVYQNAPFQIQRRVSSQLAPFPVLRYFFLILGVLFFSPLILLFLIPGIFDDKEIFLVSLATIITIFCLLAVLVGIYLTRIKTPYVQEWKDKLGYFE